MEVTAKLGKDGAKGTVEYEFGKDLDESADLFGPETVHSKFVAAAKVDLQAAIRRCLEGGTDPQAFADDWKPGMRAPSVAKDPMAMALAGISKMSDEQKAELIAKLRG
uniref:Uncharacterized protein n=1 Tax=viral metagenome TaxID=1070528 RepID=A0A6M3KZH9_9ZZZZ